MLVGIRSFGLADAGAVREVHLEAFAGRENEARLVESLHAASAAPVSLVAVDKASGGVVGHVLFSPVEIRDGRASIRAVGLAPVGVLLRSGALDGAGGTVRYRPEFDQVDA